MKTRIRIYFRPVGLGPVKGSTARYTWLASDEFPDYVGCKLAYCSDGYYWVVGVPVPASREIA
jgi:hypothetical protein